MFFEKKIRQRIIKTPYNMKRCLRFFYFYILNIAKFWLNILMDDCATWAATTKRKKTLASDGGHKT